MFSLFTRYFFIIFCSFYTYGKIVNIKFERKVFIISLLYITLISYVILLLSTNTTIIRLTVIFLSCGRLCGGDCKFSVALCCYWAC